jgi:hypothetical protein
MARKMLKSIGGMRRYHERHGVGLDEMPMTTPATDATYLAGAKVERTYPFGPLQGAAVMTAMVSHAGTCCFGMTIDHSVVPDPGAGRLHARGPHGGAGLPELAWVVRVEKTSA